MFDNISLDVQTEIFKRVSDVKSLIRMRSVSKPWKSLIDSSQFVAGYHTRKTQPYSFLLSYEDNSEVEYLSVNNDTFKVQQDLAPNVSDLMRQHSETSFTAVIGYSRGLLCVYTFSGQGMLVLWNPSLRRSVGILGAEYYDVFGFAVCPFTNEPTIVKISKPWKVEVFTLSSKIWTAIQCRKPRESIKFHERSHVVIGSCIYRVAYESIRLPDEFKAIDLPDKITNPFTSHRRVIISKLKGFVVVIAPHAGVKVWKMESDCSFAHLFTFNTPDSDLINIVGFRKNGELLFETQESCGRLGFYGETKKYALKIYDPCSQHIKDLGFSGHSGSFFVSSYRETLHLLDHSDSYVYPEIN